MQQEIGQFQNFNTINFDPNQIANQTSSVIQFIVVLDVSPSISSFESAMNQALEEVFMNELKNCHRKDDIMVKCITFCENVEHKSGFQPILNLPNNYLQVRNQGMGTALYEAVATGLKESIAYRTDLEDQGIDVRTALFIVTDGEDNSSTRGNLTYINQAITDLKSNEGWINSFNITMLGVGRDSSFRASCIEMGLDPDKCLVTINNSAAEIRKAFGVVSQSVSSSAAPVGASF